MEPIVGMMDDALTWSEAFAIGHEALDADHRALIKIFNEICAAVRAGQTLPDLRSLLTALGLAIDGHFARESAILREMTVVAKRAEEDSPRNRSYLKAMSDTALRKHDTDHGAERAKFSSIVLAPRLGIDAAGSQLCRDLKDWLLDHTMKYDAPLKAIFRVA